MADAKQQHERLPPVLTGKKALIVGVANEHSIAWGCAQAMRRAGAEIAMTYLNDRARPHVEPLAKALDAEIFLPLEVRDPAQVDGLFAQIAERWGGLDILVHSVAFAPRDALQGRVVDCPRDGFLAAMDVSCWSFLDLARRAESLMRQGGTMMTMSYLGANEVVDNYGIMGPVKAALEASVRYLATEFGPGGIRVNAVSPGPMRTRAASGIAGFDDLIADAQRRAPLTREVEIDDVGSLCAFLVSDAARAITGDVHYIDGGLHILA